MGWLGWSALLLLAVALAIAALALWATRTGSVTTLDRLDALFPHGRGAIRVESVSYGEVEAQKLRLWVPKGPRPATGWPMVAFYHGGSWSVGDPDQYDFVARALASRGYATALIGYRLNAAGKFPAMLEDSAAGLRRALDDAPGHGIDARRVVLAGHSAGAYNAVMLALDPQWLERARIDRRRIVGVAGLSGPYDFYPFRWTASRFSFGDWPRPEETQPLRFVRPGAPPMLLLTGSDDQTVRPRNTLALAKALAKAGSPAQVVEIAGMGHGGPVITLAKPFDRDARVGNALFAWLAKVLPPQGTSATVQPAKP